MEWDLEMIEMKVKLDKFLNENYIMYSRTTCDYIAYPKSEGKPEGYDKWKEDHLSSQRINSDFRRQQENREKRRKRDKRKREDAPILICQVCGYRTQTYFPGAFNRHHNDNCRFQGENK
jgi:rubrerythrin